MMHQKTDYQATYETQKVVDLFAKRNCVEMLCNSTPHLVGD